MPDAFARSDPILTNHLSLQKKNIPLLRRPTISHTDTQQTAKMSLELTYQDVAEHNTKKDLYVVIHDVIYDCTKFVDEHP